MANDTIAVPGKLASTLRELANADVSRASDKVTVGLWDSVIRYAFGGDKTKDNPHGFELSKFDAAKIIYMGEFVARWGCAQTTAADVKAGKGTQADADKFDYVKRTGRATWGMGTNRAIARAGFERPKQNAGGGKGKGNATVPAATGTETTAMLPPSFLHDMQETSGALQKFQAHYGAKLTKQGKDAIGEVCALHAKCMAALVPHVPNAAGKETPTKGATIQ